MEAQSSSANVPKVEIVPNATDPNDETCRTFVINNEDHTIGNLLQFVINKYPDVQFCGYNIPHPSEDKIQVRIQTIGGVLALDVLTRALKDIDDVFDSLKQKFQTACDEYTNTADVDVES